ncbi:efflux transporter outer membrane subunit [Novosphingobium sp. FSY-8]|uniref:Efflux transporter outer membrane subunit n=1 Tax=Novosphingobium ovatum TaxID=1908523 RepID=A0ABW9XDW6_9SPHN|nr:efflux transporter outer membrane subunit [Novosphingobium ovatum]NBC36734.1 efflux transporter outer membrane subunit [Novosphingobium ovatum]
MQTTSSSAFRRAGRTTALLGVSALGAGLLVGCAAVPHGGPRDAPRLHAASAAGMGLNADAPPVIVAPDWWHGLNDPQLDRIIADALEGNPGLQQAMARLATAQSAIETARARQLPSASAGASTEYQRFSEKSIYPPPYAGNWYWMSNATGDVSWSLDIAGRQKAMVDAAAAHVRASGLETQAARVALAGSIAQTYVNLARAEAQAGLARDFVTSREAGLKVVQARVQAQLATGIDVAAAQTLLAEARQAQVRAEGARDLMVHALAALAGRGADYYATITAPTLRLDTPMVVPQVLPADLLARRADIQAARQRIEMASAAQRVARAAFYPDVDLHAFVGASALGLGSLATPGALTAGAGPAVHLPLFQGGALRARYRAATAGIDQMIATYNETVVGAVRDTADALSAIQTNARDADQARAVIAGLERTVALDHVRLQSGLAMRLDVLNAGERLLAARQGAVDIAADGQIRRIQLLIALGGGFTPIPAAAPGQR